MTATLPATASELRRHNTARVLRALRDDGPLSRTALARRTGLAKATVGAIVGDLRSAGAVEERAHDASARGRPSRPVDLHGGRFVALGVEVNVDYVALVGLGLSRETVLSRQIGVGGGAPTVDAVETVVRDAATGLRDDGHTLLGVTVAVPGLVDRDGVRVTYAPNLGWSDVDVGGVLRDALETGAVRVDNDANCAALAETACGVARGCGDIVYLTGAVGIGAGIVVGGSAMRGGLGYAGEVGHMRIADPDALCGCGRSGCWEAAIGLRAMLRAVGLAETVAGGGPMAIGQRVAELAAEDSGVRARLDEVADSLAAGAAMLANAIGPQLIVLGGYFVPLGPWLLPKVRATLRTEVFAGPGCRAELSTLGLRAAAIGAASQILDDVYEARLVLPGR